MITVKKSTLKKVGVLFLVLIMAAAAVYAIPLMSRNIPVSSKNRSSRRRSGI